MLHKPGPKKRGRKRKNPELTEDERALVRKLQNRESAKLSRVRRKVIAAEYEEQITELVDNNKRLHDQVTALNNRLSFLQSLLTVHVTPTGGAGLPANVQNAVGGGVGVGGGGSGAGPVGGITVVGNTGGANVSNDGAGGSGGVGGAMHMGGAIPGYGAVGGGSIGAAGGPAQGGVPSGAPNAGAAGTGVERPGPNVPYYSPNQRPPVGDQGDAQMRPADNRQAFQGGPPINPGGR